MKTNNYLTHSDLEVSFTFGCSTQNLGSSICLSPLMANNAKGESLDHMIWNKHGVVEKG